MADKKLDEVIKKTEKIGEALTSVPELGKAVDEVAKEVKKTVKKVIKDSKKTVKTATKEVKKIFNQVLKTPEKGSSEGSGKKKITKKQLEEKAKKLAEKLSGVTNTEELKEELKASRKTLVPVEDYVKSGIYIGTKVITPHLRKFVYRRRNDGIAIIDINVIDEELKKFVKAVSEYNPEDFIVVCKREAGWDAVKKFSELTGVRVFTKKYPAGILTNPALSNFFETDMVLVCDPWIDKNAMRDGKNVKKKIFALCDTNNYSFDVDLLTPCNNKSPKALGLVFYILTREYLKAKKIKKEVLMSDFVELE
jgi:small subunit ribosomal protein S2